VPDVQVRAAHGRGQPGPRGQLPGTAEPADIADLGDHDQRGELPDAGQRPQHLDLRVSLGVLVQLPVDPVDDRRQAVDDRQAVGDDLPRRRGQVQLGQPAAATDIAGSSFSRARDSAKASERAFREVSRAVSLTAYELCGCIISGNS
jgi:hypothetical protein